MKQHRVIIIGAGAAGIGMGVTFKELGMEDVCILEKEDIGATFKKWPKSTKTITPSFTSNGFGIPDLNAVTKDTSPAFTFKTEHISGDTYAEYLEVVADHYALPITTGVTVTHVTQTEQGYVLDTASGEQYACQYVFVATGDFHFPKQPFEHGVHYSEIKDFDTFSADEYVVIGGNESAFDAAIQLGCRGKKVTIVARHSGFNAEDADPSVRLSPFTYDRLKARIAQGDDIVMHTNMTVNAVTYDETQRMYKIVLRDQTVINTPVAPIVATGFDISQNPIVQQLFRTDGAHVILTSSDESTRFTNVFLIGPNVEHDDAKLCYIYKFRARFAVLAEKVMEREGLKVDEAALGAYKLNQMYLDDVSCCEVSCTC